MRSRNSKLAPVLRAMDAFTAPAQPAEPQHDAAYWDRRISRIAHVLMRAMSHTMREGIYPRRERVALVNRLHDLRLAAMRQRDAAIAKVQPQPPECAIEDCHETAAYMCVCCNRMVCALDMADSRDYDCGPSLCNECLFDCRFTLACQVVSHV